MQRNSRGFGERRVLGSKPRRQSMEIARRRCDSLRQSAGHVQPEEFAVVADIGFAFATAWTVAAPDHRFDEDSIAGSIVLNLGTNLADKTAELVAHDDGGDGPLRHRVPLGDVQVAATNRGTRHIKYDFVGARSRARDLAQFERAWLWGRFEECFHAGQT